MSKQLITCPSQVPLNSYRTVFLAGGITNCNDWQHEFWNSIPTDLDITCVNPRRIDFDVTNGNILKEQIEWEHLYLNECDYICFWFPSETVCPITLYEFGKALAQGAKLVVGTHPNYSRREDIIHQTRLMNPFIVIVDSLPDLLEQLLELSGTDAPSY